MIERHEYDAPDGRGVNEDEVPYSAPAPVRDPERDQLHALLDRLHTVSALALSLRVRVESLHAVLSGRGAIDTKLAAKVTAALRKVERAGKPKRKGTKPT